MKITFEDKAKTHVNPRLISGKFYRVLGIKAQYGRTSWPVAFYVTVGNSAESRVNFFYADDSTTHGTTGFAAEEYFYEEVRKITFEM